MDFINFYFQVAAQDGEKLGHKVKEPEAETIMEHFWLACSLAGLSFGSCLANFLV